MDISKIFAINDSNEFVAIYDYQNSIYRISLKVPEYPLMKNSKINILKDLSNFTVEYNEDSDDITEFLNKFNLAVNSKCDGRQLQECTLQQKRKDILNQLTLLSRNDMYDISVAADFTAINISSKNHYLLLSVTKDMEIKVLDHSLPECKIKWFHSSTGKIESFFYEFVNTLEQLDEFYRNINTIDELCFVVDPVQPSTKINWRIVRIDRKCFAKVSIDPFLPSSVTVSFIGPTLAVERYRDQYDKEISNWDHELDVHKNLLKIFGLVYFPMKYDENEEEEEEGVSCAICGLFRMDDRIPMISCDNVKCDLVYHVACLKQWWSMFVDSKTFLNVELGTKCPTCKEKLSTSFNQMLN